MHLLVSLDNTLHIYWCLSTHVLMADRQFLLLIDVPIQNRAQQLQVYEIFSLPVPCSNLSAQHKIKYKYIGVAYDETEAFAISDLQYSTWQHASGQFYRINVPFQPPTNLPSCITTLYAKNNQAINEQCSLVISYMSQTCTYCCYFKSLNHFLKPQDTRINSDNNLPRQGH